MNGKYYKLAGALVFFIVILSAVFSAGVYVGEKRVPAIEKIYNLANKKTDKLQEADFSIFWENWKLLEDNFVFKEKLNRQNMIYGAVSGLVKSLNDPYTVFLTPAESKKFIEDVSGSFDGIGAEIGIRKNQLLIIAPLKDTPAERAGLRPLDKILKIDDKSTVDLTLEEAVSLIRGPKGATVALLIDRGGFDKPKEFKIVRNTIKIPVIKWEIKEGTAVVQVYSFSNELTFEFRRVSREIINSGTDKLIIDLRNNPGGYLEVSREIASYFLPWGKVVTIEDDGNNDKTYFKSYGYNMFKSFKIAVLVNSGSASASEILAGALRDNLGVKLIGEKTYGKGSVQELMELKDGSSVKITIASWLTPNGVKITDVGLEPDYKVELTDKDIENNKDPQLDKAVETVRGL